MKNMTYDQIKDLYSTYLEVRNSPEMEWDVAEEEADGRNETEN